MSLLARGLLLIGAALILTWWGLSASFAQNGLTKAEKQPPAYSLELNQDDRDRMDELIVEVRQLNTMIKKIMATNEQEPRKMRRRSRRAR